MKSHSKGGRNRVSMEFVQAFPSQDRVTLQNGRIVSIGDEYMWRSTKSSRRLQVVDIRGRYVIFRNIVSGLLTPVATRTLDHNCAAYIPILEPRVEAYGDAIEMIETAPNFYSSVVGDKPDTVKKGLFGWNTILQKLFPGRV